MMDEIPVFGRPFPRLETRRLVLRELREADVDDAFEMFSNPEVMRYIGRPVHKSLDDTRRILERNWAQFPQREGVHWAITLSGKDRLIGSCGHWRLMKEHKRAELGYDLLPAYWGQGIMSEALQAILRFGFTQMGLHSTEAQIDPANLRSRRVLERAGFRQDGLIRENYYSEGRFLDTAIFTLLGREFLGREATG